MTDCPQDVVSIECRDERSVLTLAGAVGVASAVCLHRAAVAIVERGLPVTIDCRGVEYVDGAAVQLLVGFDRALAARGVAPRYEGVPGEMHALMTIAGCEGVLSSPASSTVGATDTVSVPEAAK